MDHRRAVERSPARRRRIRNGTRHLPRSRRRSPSNGIRRVVPAPSLCPGGGRGRAAGHVQPARTGLVAASVAPRRFARHGFCPLAGHGANGPQARRRPSGRPRHGPLSPVVDSRRQRSGQWHVRAIRPRGDGRHPHARGVSGGRRRRRRRPRKRRTVGARIPG